MVLLRVLSAVHCLLYKTRPYRRVPELGGRHVERRNRVIRILLPVPFSACLSFGQLFTISSETSNPEAPCDSRSIPTSSSTSNAQNRVALRSRLSYTVVYALQPFAAGFFAPCGVVRVPCAPSICRPIADSSLGRSC